MFKVMPTGIYKRIKPFGFQKGNAPLNTGRTHFKKGQIPWNKGKTYSFKHDKQFKKGRIPWNKGKKGLQIAWNKGKHHTEETKKKISEKKKGKIPYIMTNEIRKKMSEAQTGEKNYQWIKDRSLVMLNKRNDPEYLQWVRLVKKRDKNVCRINNKDCSGYCIVHHILPWRDFPELRYNTNNGITLCQAHHPRKRAEEKRLIPFFQGLVSVSNEVI